MKNIKQFYEPDPQLRESLVKMVYSPLIFLTLICVFTYHKMQEMRNSCDFEKITNDDLQTLLDTTELTQRVKKQDILYSSLYSRGACKMHIMATYSSTFFAWNAV